MARACARRTRHPAAAGRPRRGFVWETACLLVRQYEFAESRILRAVYRGADELLGRDMLLEGRFCGLRFYLGVRVTEVIDETRDSDGAAERVWGWSYQTLQGHLEQGRLSYEVIKNLAAGQVIFRVSGYSRRAPIPNPLIRWGFRLFGRWMQERFYRAVQRRLHDLMQAARRGGSLPVPAALAGGVVIAPSGVTRTRWSGWPVPGSTREPEGPPGSPRVRHGQILVPFGA